MKKIAAYCLLFVFFVAFTYETLNYFSKKFNSFLIEELSDLEAEKNASETDEGDKENEKKEKPETFYISTNDFVASLRKKKSLNTPDFIFLEADYSSIIYSPPEKSVA